MGRKLREKSRDRCLKSKRRRQQTLLFAKVTNNINHAQFPNTSTTTVSHFLVAQAPHADEALVGVLQCGQGLCHGG